jgi:hypothetical protein
MKSKVNYLSLFFAALMLIGAYIVFFFVGENQHQVTAPMQSYESLDSLAQTLSGKIIVKSSVCILGIDPNMIETSEFVNKYISEVTIRNSPFQAIIIDEGIANAVKLEKSNLIQEGFYFHRNIERLKSGIGRALEKNIKLLVIVQNADVIQKKKDSLLAQISISYPQITSIILAKAPRSREDEKNFSLPCNTGEEDRAGVAGLGCYILQKSRSWYNKKRSDKSWDAELDLLSSGENLLILNKN